MAGKFIVLEGLDGANLSYHSRHLAQKLTGRGLLVFQTREPSDGPIGRDIRLALNGRLELDKITLAVLFAADRMDHLYREKTGILARLEKGEWVISDRYYLSHYAYQTAEGGFDFDWLVALNQFARDPDLILFVDYPIRFCMREFASAHHYSVLDEAGAANLEKRLSNIHKKFQEAIKWLRTHKPHVQIEVVYAEDRRKMQSKLNRRLRQFLSEQSG